MRTFSLLLALCLGAAAYAQCDGDRYFNQIFNDFYVTSNIQYGSNLDLNVENVNLLLDVYRPYGDTHFERPLVIMVHGGSFVGGSKIGDDVVPLARDLAKMGYVVASINYRLGLPFSVDLEQPATQAVIRGYHDAKAAVRFFRMSVVEENNTYGIDEDQIYMVGVSAGGFVTLHNAYLTDEAQIPAAVDQTLPGLGGGIEGESGNPGFSSQLQGIVNIAGAMGDADWMQEDGIPVLSFHGNQDATVPYGTAMLQLFGLIDVTVVDGSATVHERAEELGVTNCFIPHFGAGHVPHVANPTYYDTTRAITANFLGHLVCPDQPLDCEYRDVTLDIANVEKNELSVYPNPARETVTVALPGAGQAFIEFYDIQGRFVADNRMNGDLQVINVGHLPRGAYIVRVVSERAVETRRIILE